MQKFRSVCLIITFYVINFTLANNNQTEEKINIKNIIKTLEKALKFVNDFYYEINFDGAVGITMAQAHLGQALEETQNPYVRNKILELIQKCQITKKIAPILSHSSPGENKLQEFFLNPKFWERNINFVPKSLNYLGYYENWTKEDILRNRSVSYGGVQSNECLIDAINTIGHNLKPHDCRVSFRCRLLMFGHRNDGGYLLTHRLFYLQIMKLINCRANSNILETQIKKYCSQILREAKTNEYYNYPYHDIFMEQILFCGVEGFEEFLIEKWTSQIVKWQKIEGCYEGNNILTGTQKRSSNVIHFGCTDHATGLAIATLALNLRYIINKIN